jgi:hypothetical protein
VHARFLGVILNAINLDDPDYSYYRAYSHYYHQDSNENGSGKTLTSKIRAGEMKNRLAQSIQHYLYKGFHPAVHGNGKNAGQNREEDWAKTFDNESSNETKEEVIFKWSDAPRTTAPGSVTSLQDKPDEILSQAFLTRLIEVFVDAVGPLGPLIVSNRISILGESQDTFPKSRIDELVKLIEPEILNPEVRLRFQKEIAEEIRNLRETETGVE